MAQFESVSHLTDDEAQPQKDKGLVHRHAKGISYETVRIFRTAVQLTHTPMFIRSVLTEQFWIFIVVVITRISTCGKLHRIHMYTHVSIHM